MLKRIHVAVMLALAHTIAHGATLGEVTEHALANSPDVRSRLHQFLSSTQDEKAGRGALLPRIDLEASYGRERLQQEPAPADYFNHPAVSLQLRQLLFDGFGTSSEIRRLGFAKATRYYELLAGTDDIALETARAYIDVQRYRQLTALAQDNWGTHKEIYDQIEDRVKAGVGRRVDLEQAAGRLALAQSNWLTETSNLHDVSARYERVVGEAPPTLVETPELTRFLPTEKDVLRIAVQDNPQFLAAVANLRAARAQTDVRRAANSPTIEFRASHDIERNRVAVPGQYKDSIAEIVLDYNLFRGGSDQARIRSALELYDTAVAERDKTCRDIRQTAAIAWNDLRKLRSQIEFLEQHMLSTEKARDAYRQQFDIGQRSLLDVLDTENELFESRRALAMAQYDLRLAEYRVLAATHRLLPALSLAPGNMQRPDEPSGGEADDNAMACGTTMPAMEKLDTVAAMANRQPRSLPAPLIPPPAPLPSAPATVPAQCEFAANDWAAAWSARDLKKYLGYYSDNFQPITRADREDWKRFRAQRLDKPSISVTLDHMMTRQTGPNSCEVTFYQHYSSSDYSDDVAKKLVLEREGKDWKIIKEVGPKKSSTN